MWINVYIRGGVGKTDVIKLHSLFVEEDTDCPKFSCTFSLMLIQAVTFSLVVFLAVF